MTQILLHKPTIEVQHQERVVMDWPWVWWETRVYPDHDGNLIMQNVDDVLDRHAAYRWTFGPDSSQVVVTDPPAMQILLVIPNPEPILFGIDDLVRDDMTPRYMTVRIAWHEPPGELESETGRLLTYGVWRPLPARTCILGDYRIETIRSRDDGPLTDPSFPTILPIREMPPLRWTETPTIRDGQAAAPRRTGYTVPNHSDLTRSPRHAAAEVPMVTARHRPQTKTIEPLPRSGTRTIDGINDDAIIAQIDQLIDDELGDGETARYQVRRAGPPRITE